MSLMAGQNYFPAANILPIIITLRVNRPTETNVKFLKKLCNLSQSCIETPSPPEMFGQSPLLLSMGRQCRMAGGAVNVTRGVLTPISQYILYH